LQNLIPIIGTCFGLSGRLPQIWTNFKQGHTGQLSLLSWSFSLGGSAVRIFTTLMEVPDKLVLGMYVVYFLCNLTLVLQIVIYWKKTEEQIRKNQVLFVCWF
jgi:singapore isolate B (sub-type 7) whole genome shotgun sequence assembly, scaffold_28